MYIYRFYISPMSPRSRNPSGTNPVGTEVTCSRPLPRNRLPSSEPSRVFSATKGGPQWLPNQRWPGKSWAKWRLSSWIKSACWFQFYGFFMFFPFHIWDVILPIDEVIFFSEGLKPPSSLLFIAGKSSNWSGRPNKNGPKVRCGIFP